MAEKVNPGDKVTAERWNSLVDSVNGVDIPTQNGYTRTESGVVFSQWSNLEAQANQRVTDVFKCAIGPATRYCTGTDPWEDWVLLGEGGSEPYRPDRKHIYVYLGVDNLQLGSALSIGQNPFLRCEDMPNHFIGWSMAEFKHIVTDKDMLVNDDNSEFDQYGSKTTGTANKVYHGWIETPFQPQPGNKIYGAFYKLLQGDSIVGTIFIMTCRGTYEDGEGLAQQCYPIQSFTTFDSPVTGHQQFIVAEQCSPNYLICEMQDPQVIPGQDLSSVSMESSKLVQHHTGPIMIPQSTQEAQGAWSILNFVSDNESGEDIEIASYWEMKLANIQWQGDYAPLAFVKLVSANGKKYVSIDNFQASGKNVLIEVDSSNPVRVGLLTSEMMESATKPFVNLCRVPKGYTTILDPDNTRYWDSYLVIPHSISDPTGTAMSIGYVTAEAFIRGHLVWDFDLKVWVIDFAEGTILDETTSITNQILLASVRYDGTNGYSWYVPRNEIFQGSFSNLCRDMPITDNLLGDSSLSSDPTVNSSLEYTRLEWGKDEDGNELCPDVTRDADYIGLSSYHPLGLQLYKFDQLDYHMDLSDITSEEPNQLSGFDVVVRWRHPQLSGTEVAKSVIDYISLSSLLSDVSCDSEISSLGLSSIQKVEGEDGEVALELFGFDDVSNVGVVDLSSLAPEEGVDVQKMSLLVREYSEDDDTAVLKYVQLSGLQPELSGQNLSADTEVSQFGLSSVVMLSTEDGKVISLHDFDRLGPNVQFDLTSLVENQGQAQGNWQFVMKHVDENENKILEYMTLSSLGLSENKVSTDTDLTNAGIPISIQTRKRSSLDTKTAMGGEEFIQLHNFEQPTSFSPSSQEDIIDYDLMANFNGIVVRREDADGYPYVDYMDFTALSNLVPTSTNLSADSDVPAMQTSSVQISSVSTPTGQKDVISLYDFGNTSTARRVALSALVDDGTHPSNTDQLLVRHYNGTTNTLQYVALTSIGGGSSGPSGAFAYDESTHTIKWGVYLRARRWVFVNDAVVSTAGYAYLQVDMGTSGGASVVTGASSLPTFTNQYMYVPLYYFDNDLKVVADYRGAPTAQMWES